LLEEHEAKHKALQAAIQEGLDSEPPRAVDWTLSSGARRRRRDVGEYRLRPRAISDLDEIWDYTASTWSEAQAER
jgi:hypothetical protein